MAVFSTPLRVLSFLVLSAALFVGGRAQGQPVHTRTDTIEVDPDVEVELHAFRGRVEVSTWERSAVRLHGEIEDTASTADEAPSIQVAGEDSILTVKPNGKTMDLDLFTALGAMTWMRGEPEGPMTVYSVRVPVDASVTLSLDAADAAVSGVEGDVKIEGVSSSVDVRDVGGRVIAGTLSGPLYAEDVRGKLIMGTAHGDLQVRLSTLANKLNVDSYTGDAEITLPADAAFNLGTDITWGDGVASDFSIPNSPIREDGTVPIGGGGPTVFFESFTGSLTLKAE